MSAWSLQFSPVVLTVDLQSEQNAPLPLRTNAELAASVMRLSPVTFSAQTHSTSELLRFL